MYGNFNCGMFNMFNIIETLWNYLACELLSYYLSSKLTRQVAKTGYLTLVSHNVSCNNFFALTVLKRQLRNA